MIFTQKLPPLSSKMKEALKSHVIRKRRRLKQEMEQDAIERRMKKEAELKQIQDAMTLDQIKEQLSKLEERLETLKGEKHYLFVQLKQVLTENTNATKQQDLQQHQQQLHTLPPQTEQASRVNDLSLISSQTIDNRPMHYHEPSSFGSFARESIKAAAILSQPKPPSNRLTSRVSTGSSHLTNNAISSVNSYPLISNYSIPSLNISTQIQDIKPITSIYSTLAREPYQALESSPMLSPTVPINLLTPGHLNFAADQYQPNDFRDIKSTRKPMSSTSKSQGIPKPTSYHDMARYPGKRSASVANINDTSHSNSRFSSRKKPSSFNYPPYSSSSSSSSMSSTFSHIPSHLMNSANQSSIASNYNNDQQFHTSSYRNTNLHTTSFNQLAANSNSHMDHVQNFHNKLSRAEHPPMAYDRFNYNKQMMPDIHTSHRLSSSHAIPTTSYAHNRYNSTYPQQQYANYLRHNNSHLTSLEHNPRYLGPSSNYYTKKPYHHRSSYHHSK